MSCISTKIFHWHESDTNNPNLLGDNRTPHCHCLENLSPSAFQHHTHLHSKHRSPVQACNTCSLPPSMLLVHPSLCRRNSCQRLSSHNLHLRRPGSHQCASASYHTRLHMFGLCKNPHQAHTNKSVLIHPCRWIVIHPPMPCFEANRHHQIPSVLHQLQWSKQPMTECRRCA